MWEPRRLTSLWVFTACYRDGSTFLRAGIWAPSHACGAPSSFSQYVRVLPSQLEIRWSNFHEIAEFYGQLLSHFDFVLNDAVIATTSHSIVRSREENWNKPVKAV
jgi:hypothetical protein